MTLLIAWAKGTEGLIAVDTEGARSDGHKAEFGKFFPLVGIAAVISGRGNIDYLREVVMWAQISSLSFDEIAANLAVVMGAAWSVFARNLETAPEEISRLMEIQPHQEVALIGWSTSANEMRLFCGKRDGESGEIQVAERPWCISPWDVDAQGMPAHEEPNSVERIADIARAQVAHFKPINPKAGLGGRLILAQLTPYTMLISSPCQLA